jgi:F0F1-type ATP synthase membrane subunit c/vacuolar-type H+-ATPase subunit K
MTFTTVAGIAVFCGGMHQDGAAAAFIQNIARTTKVC